MQAPHYSADDFPGDLFAALRTMLAVVVVLGPLSWYLGRLYLERTYPGHPEILPSAVVLGLVDGVLLGGLAGGFTFARRIWRRERDERKRSDALLRLALQDLDDSQGAPPRQDDQPRK